MAPDFAGDLLAALLPFIVLWLMTLLLNQRLDLALMFSFICALTGLLLLSAINGLTRGFYKLWVLSRHQRVAVGSAGAVES